MSGSAPEGARSSPTRTKLLAISAAVAVGLGGLVWLVVAVVVPLFRTAACAGVEFRPEGANVVDTRERPPLGGTGGLAGELRSALRPPDDVVFCDDFADPSVLRTDVALYAFATNTEDYNVPVLTSDGLFGTAKVSEALPELPRWTTDGKVWAPSVTAVSSGFALYYSTAAPDPSRECLSVAISGQANGPFVDDSAGPLVCPDGGGAIDPSVFTASDGRKYLLRKEFGGEDGIVAQELSADGRTLTGPREVLLRSDQFWEGGIVEGPSMLEHEGRYYLFYSGNAWSSEQYAMGYAVCDSPLGPCVRAPNGPWLASTERAKGPGGGEVFLDRDAQPWMVLHAWIEGRVGYPDGARNLFVIPLAIVDGTPVAG